MPKAKNADLDLLQRFKSFLPKENTTLTSRPMNIPAYLRLFALIDKLKEVKGGKRGQTRKKRRQSRYHRK
jgi:hypothetical protein